MSRTLLAFVHIASQVANRWLAPPLESLEGLPSAPENCTADDWRSLALSPSTSGLLPWLNRYLSRVDPGADRLAKAAVEHFAAVREFGATYATLDDPLYPMALAAIKDPPPALTLTGEHALLQRPTVAVVGARKASGLAVQTSFHLGLALAEAGILVVSGGAFGCDIAAHQGVLAAGVEPAPAACVFASGLRRLYPAGNGGIFRQLERRQALMISERLWPSGCFPMDFPVRNRIIAGLASTTIVMQAGERSGAQVTARLALDFGRDVAVLRHPPEDVRAAASHLLLRDGAPGFDTVKELMESLSFYPGVAIRGRSC